MCPSISGAGREVAAGPAAPTPPRTQTNRQRACCHELHVPMSPLRGSHVARAPGALAEPRLPRRVSLVRLGLCHLGCHHASPQAPKRWLHKDRRCFGGSRRKGDFSKGVGAAGGLPASSLGWALPLCRSSCPRMGTREQSSWSWLKDRDVPFPAAPALPTQPVGWIRAANDAT